MDEYTVDAFVNRDGPIPYVSLETTDELSENGGIMESDKDGTKHGARKYLSKSNIKEQVHKVTGKADTGPSIQDRLLEK